MSYFVQLSFGNFMLADKFFAKALRSLKTCVLVNNTYVKIILIIGITSHTWWKISSYFVSFLISDFNLLNQFIILSQFLVKNLKCFFLFFNNEKYCRTHPHPHPTSFLMFRFPVKLVCCIASGPVSSVCCLLESIAIIL